MPVSSPVRTLDRLLRVSGERSSKIFFQIFPEGLVKQSGPVSLIGRPALNWCFVGRGGRI